MDVTDWIFTFFRECIFWKQYRAAHRPGCLHQHEIDDDIESTCGDRADRTSHSLKHCPYCKPLIFFLPGIQPAILSDECLAWWVTYRENLLLPDASRSSRSLRHEAPVRSGSSYRLWHFDTGSMRHNSSIREKSSIPSYLLSIALMTLLANLNGLAVDAMTAGAVG